MAGIITIITTLFSCGSNMVGAVGELLGGAGTFIRMDWCLT